MQRTPCLFQEAAVQQRYMSRALTRSPCDGMINDRQRGEQGTCSQGRFDMKESWDIHALALCIGLFSIFVLPFLRLGSSDARAVESGRFEGLPL